MAILKNYTPAVHDIHLYGPTARRDPMRYGNPYGFNPTCQGAHVDWSGVSLRPQAFSTVVPEPLRMPDWAAPFDVENLNFYNTTNPCAVLVSRRHALICQHYRGTQPRTNETYTFMGRDGTRHTRTVVDAQFSVGPDHTLLTFDSDFPECVSHYGRIADPLYIPPGTRLWNHDCNGRAYQTEFVRSMPYGYLIAPVRDGVNDGIKANGLPGIFVGDSGSPVLALDARGNTVLVGLMYGGMQVGPAELALIDVGAEHVRLAARIEDVNGDGAVDGDDMARVLAEWGNGNRFVDMNADGVLDGSDQGMVLAAWGPYELLPNPTTGGVLGGGPS